MDRGGGGGGANSTDRSCPFKTYTAHDRFHGSGSYGKISIKKSQSESLDYYILIAIDLWPYPSPGRLGTKLMNDK